MVSRMASWNSKAIFSILTIHNSELREVNARPDFHNKLGGLSPRHNRSKVKTLNPGNRSSVYISSFSEETSHSRKVLKTSSIVFSIVSVQIRTGNACVSSRRSKLGMPGLQATLG